MNRQWVEPAAVDVPAELAAAVGGHPLVAQTLARRGVTDPDAARRFLYPADYVPASPFDLPDMERAVARIEQAIGQREPVLIWGDFDVDGQTATALLVSALGDLGARVSYHVPLRETEGHGVYIPTLEALIDEGRIGLLVTCDTGITAHEAVDAARARGVDVVITDHHKLGDTLPDAYAVVNPQRLPETHPLRTLPGVGCAYKLVEALYARANPAAGIDYLLDLVALGIVADVAEQTGDTRYLLQRGLGVLRHTDRPGLQAMFALAELVPEQINEGHIAFSLGPRLNAVGRLDDAARGVELLTTRDEERARILANMLEGLNRERQLLSRQVYAAAVGQVEENPKLLDYGVLVLAHERWPGGIVGIVASRLVERYGQPVLLLSVGEDGMARGSARSVDGIDITAAIARCADLLTRYGGHAMAAGLSLPEARIPDLRRALASAVAQSKVTVSAESQLIIDNYVPLGDLSLLLVDDLERLAPFGAGNPAPIFAAARLTRRGYRLLGRNSEHIRVTVEDEAGEVHDVLWWQGDEDALPAGRFDLAYHVRATTFRGERQLTIEWVDGRALDEEPAEFAYRGGVQAIDRRDIADPLAALDDVRRDYPDMAIWQEGQPGADAGGVPRHELEPAPVLVIWTAPPDPDALADALRRVNPGTVILFGVDPRADSVQGFLQRFGGLVKHVLSTNMDAVSPAQLGGMTAQSGSVVRVALAWMVARGHIVLTETDTGLRITAGDGTADDSRRAESTAQLATAIQEAAAYRAYFKRADAAALVRIPSSHT